MANHQSHQSHQLHQSHQSHKSRFINHLQTDHDWCVYIQPSRDTIYGIIGTDDACDRRLSHATIVRMSIGAASCGKPRRGVGRLITVRGRWAQSLVQMIDSRQFAEYPHDATSFDAS